MSRNRQNSIGNVSFRLLCHRDILVQGKIGNIGHHTVKRVHNKFEHLNGLGLSDAMTPRDSLVFNGRVPMRTDEIDFAVIVL